MEPRTTVSLDGSLNNGQEQFVEEDDIFQRSKNRVWSKYIPLISSQRDVDMDYIERAPLNFKATLVGSSSSLPEEMDDYVLDVEDDTTTNLDDHDCPVVPVTKEENIVFGDHAIRQF